MSVVRIWAEMVNYCLSVVEVAEYGVRRIDADRSGVLHLVDVLFWWVVAYLLRTWGGDSLLPLQIQNKGLWWFDYFVFKGEAVATMAEIAVDVLSCFSVMNAVPER